MSTDLTGQNPIQFQKMFLKKALPIKMLSTAFVFVVLWMLSFGMFLWPASKSSLLPIHLRGQSRVL